MSEDNTEVASDNTNAPSFQIQRVYLKDISLEQPNAPQVFLVQGEPNVQIQIDIQCAAIKLRML